jgi:hypothetical protein
MCVQQRAFHVVVAAGLSGAGGKYATAHGRRTFSRLCVGKGAERESGHPDAEVDTVAKRPGQFASIVFHL